MQENGPRKYKENDNIDNELKNHWKASEKKQI